MVKLLEVNKILVEGKNDVAFINALLKFINKKIDVSAIDVKSLEKGLSENTLTIALEEFRDKEIYHYNKLGIIIDIDNNTQKERLDFIASIINKVFSIKINVEDVGTEYSITFNKNSFILSIWLMNVNGKGELMTVLREIKKQNSSIADCIQVCCSQKNDFNQKAFDDDWSHLYMKWDCCSLKERKSHINFSLALKLDETKMTEDEKKVAVENNYQKLVNAWDFGHNSIELLRNYLTQFQ